MKLHKAVTSLQSTKNASGPRAAPARQDTRDLGEIAEFLDEDQDMHVKLVNVLTPHGRKKKLLRQITEREERYERHVKTKSYASTRDRNEYVNDQDEADAEADANAFNRSVGSSVSSGGLLEKDMANLMDQELAKSIRQRRKERRTVIERQRLNRTASH